MNRRRPGPSRPYTQGTERGAARKTIMFPAVFGIVPEAKPPPSRNAPRIASPKRTRRPESWQRMRKATTTRPRGVPTADSSTGRRARARTTTWTSRRPTRASRRRCRTWTRRTGAGLSMSSLAGPTRTTPSPWPDTWTRSTRASASSCPTRRGRLRPARSMTPTGATPMPRS